MADRPPQPMRWFLRVAGPRLGAGRSAAAVLLLAAAVILGAFLRFFRLDELPVGFSFDEASHALDALDILRGRPMLISPRLRETPAAYMWLLAGAFRLWGVSPFVQRSLTAACGVVLLPVNFLAVREMFREDSEDKAEWIAGFSSLLLAASFWGVFVGRLGYEYVLPPVCALGASLVFWRAWPRPRWGLVCVAAALAAAGFYFYDGGFAFLVVLPATAFTHRLLQCRRPASCDPLASARRPSLRVSASLLLLTLMFVTPLFFALTTGPDPEYQRLRDALIPVRDPAWGPRMLERSAVAHTTTLLGISGNDKLARGYPALSPFLGACLVGGLLVSLRRLRRLPYLFLLVYWSAMLTPDLLTFRYSVSYLRMAGALPATCVLIAIAWVEFSTWVLTVLESLWTRTRPSIVTSLAMAPCLLAGLVWLPLHTYREYFQWTADPQAQLRLDMAAVELTKRMAQETDPQVVFLVGRPPWDQQPHFTIEFFNHGRVPLRYVAVHEVDVDETLASELSSHRVVHVVARLRGGKEGYSRGADLLDALNRIGEVVAVEETAYYTIVTYRSAGRPDPSSAGQLL